MSRSAVAAFLVVALPALADAEAAQFSDESGNSFTVIDNVEQNILSAVDEDGVWFASAAISSDVGAVLILEDFAPTEPPSGTSAQISQADSSKIQTWVVVDRGLEHVIELFDEVQGHFVETLSVVGLEPVLESSDAVSLRDAAGTEAMRYSQLFVFDALQRPQAAWFEIAGSQIEIHVEADIDAEWPLTIDPILSTSLVIGCPASVCEDQNAPLLGGEFGTGIATGILSPGTGCSTCSATKPSVVIGVPLINVNNGFTNRGGIVIFTQNATNQLVFDSFHPMETGCGQDVAIGDVHGTADNDIIVGCPLSTGVENGVRDGVLQVHDGPGFSGGFSGTVRLLVDPFNALLTEDRHLGMDFEVGYVTNDSKADIVATTEFHHGGEADRKVLRYNLLVSEDAVVEGTLPLEESNGSPFGFHTTLLNIDRNAFVDVVIGHPNGVRVFLGSATGLSQIQEVTRPTGTAVTSVTTAAGDFDGDGDDDLALGNEGDSTLNGDQPGEVLVYKNNNGTFDTSSPLIIPGTPDQRLGSAMYAADFNDDRHDDLLFCGRGQDTRSATCMVRGGQVPRAGAALLAPTIRWQTSHGNDTGFGTLPPTSADLVGDGAQDFFIGLPRLSVGTCPAGEDCGEMRRWSGNPARISTEYSSPESNIANLRIGADEVVLADLNSDGFDDLIVSARGFMQGTATVGRVLVYKGGTTMDEVADWVLTGNTSVLAVGGAFAVGRFRGPTNPRSIAISAANGHVYVFHGGSNAFPPGGTAAQISNAAQDLKVPLINDETIEEIVSAGTVLNTSEGLAVGAPGKASAGSVYLYSSSSSGLSAEPVTIRGSAVGCSSSFGRAVASAGNVDSSGRDDLLVGAPLCGTNSEGRAFLYTSFGSPPTWTYETNEDKANVGASVAGLGDVSGDGIADFAVGGTMADGGALDSGQVYVFFGRSGVPSLTPADFLWTNRGGARFGASIAGGRDWDSDGLMDIVVGAPGWSDNTTIPNKGMVAFYRGDPTGTRDVFTTIVGTVSNQSLGTEVAMGQVTESYTQDFYGDVAYSIPGFTNGQTAEGKVSIRIGTW